MLLLDLLIVVFFPPNNNTRPDVFVATIYLHIFQLIKQRQKGFEPNHHFSLAVKAQSCKD